MKSIWEEHASKPSFNALEGDISTDILIVGGGLTGILCAYMLKEAGVDYTLIEAREICGGITKNTTAKVTAQHGLIYHKLIKKYGKGTAKLYYEANSKAVDKYRKLCAKHCVKFESKSAFVYSTEDTSRIEAEIKAYGELGVPVNNITTTPLPFSITGAVELEEQGQIHPLKLLYRLSTLLNIKENTKLMALDKNHGITDKGKICFKKAIIATHFPFLNIRGGYFLKMFQHRSYVVALQNAADVSGMYIGEDEKRFSFRNHGNFLLLGGGGHRTGKNGGGYKQLELFAKKHYPNAKITHRWATQDCMTLDGMPYIGMLSKSTPEIFVATGYNKWGFSSAMTAAEVLRDAVMERQNDCASIFTPSRKALHPQLLINAAESIFNLLRPTAPRCTHMGCALKYNKEEKTWDCPCHGSRFSRESKLIDNPATKNKAFK